MWRLSLDKMEPVALGGVRRVFRHPDDPTLLVKVIRPDIIDQKFGSGRKWHKSLPRRYRQYISYLREIREQIAIFARSNEHPDFVQRVVGFADTDLGPGLIVAAEFGRDGKLAPTLYDQIVRGRFDAKMRADLDRFCAVLQASDVMVGDLHPRNLVYAYTPERGDHFVIIDGLGFKTVVPLERVHRFFNRFSKRTRIRTMLRNIERLETRLVETQQQQQNSGGSSAQGRVDGAYALRRLSAVGLVVVMSSLLHKSEAAAAIVASSI